MQFVGRFSFAFWAHLEHVAVAGDVIKRRQILNKCGLSAVLVRPVDPVQEVVLEYLFFL